MRKIITSYWEKPIPARLWDWVARFDGDEPDDSGRMLTGYGPTKEAAIAELLYLADEQ